MLVRKANRKGPDRSLIRTFCIVCLGFFGRKLRFEILEHSCNLENKKILIRSFSNFIKGIKVIVHMISLLNLVILLPSADSFKKGCCQLLAKVCARITGNQLVQACPGKSVVR